MKAIKEVKCTICGTDLEVPLCCNEQMRYEKDQEKGNEYLVCNLCNSTEPIPICCKSKATVNV